MQHSLSYFQAMSEITDEVQHKAEIAVFILNYDNLWHEITSPDEVAAKLYSKKLIGDVQLEAIQSTSL